MGAELVFEDLFGVDVGELRHGGPPDARSRASARPIASTHQRLSARPILVSRHHIASSAIPTRFMSCNVLPAAFFHSIQPLAVRPSSAPAAPLGEENA